MRPITQDLLRECAERRLAASGVDKEDVAREGTRALRRPGDKHEALVVLRGFDVATFVRGTVAFVAGMPAALRAGWYREFTRTVFLIGDPARLSARFRFDHVLEDRSCAWLAPDPERTGDTLRRLLRPLVTVGEARLPERVEVIAPADGQRRLRQVVIAKVGLALERYLVHLNHLLAEAVIAGHLGPDDDIVVQHVDEITSLPDELLVLRVHMDESCDGRLRAYGIVTGS